MSLNKNNFSIIFFLLGGILLSAQSSQEKDSIVTERLEEVVVTGESQVMSLSKKLFTVGVIDQKGISRLAGNNLADVLTQNLNITIVPDASTGKSTVSMFGLDGEYVKVLIDGIPIASDNGIGNNIDISQINLEDVERVEIIEGSAGVLYGDNAVAGVINIVTKRGIEGDHTWQIQSSVQEETIGSEYSLFDRGRHIQNVKVSNQISPAISYTLGASRNDYAGFYNDFQGRDYVNIEDNRVVNDGLRGTEWNPREQVTLFGNFNMSLGKHRIFYKLQYFDESLTIYNRTVNGRLDSNTGAVNPTALDEDYNTQRLMNNVNISGPLKGSTTYNVSLSHQNQKRYFEQYVYNILQRGIESYTADDLNQSSDILYSKGFISNMMPKSKFFNLLVGYEFTRQQGFDAIATGAFSTDVVENTLENYDFFASADLNLNDKLSFYPGLRSVSNSQFGNKLVWSLSSTYDFSETSKLKLAVGSAFRAPNFTELFFFFVDANHNVRGNPNLNPEDGISIFLNADHLFKIGEDRPLKSTLTSFYYDIDNRIASVADTDEDGRALFTFGNVDFQRILGFSLTNKVTFNNWQAGLGASYIGQSTAVDETADEDFGYLWNLNLQSTLTYTIPEIKTSLSALLKYTGRTQNIIQGDNGLEIGQTDDFTWLDASVRTTVFKNFDVTLGARNLLDIVTVNATDIPAGTHGVSGGNNRLFGNGRSYFLKLLYTLNLN
ncbi:TonB-dependent receptor [Muricauda sp. SCSIO 64092]|uniref:TonB-dependent receptor plug domain-containing protein n=1 Tax=Allomuricauda sp. SCSIO 64092 TaxID=2908842 RepID=UPI001FF4A2D5|nr:TonB-dependent receptor [Muricauda sp. SCSIO 64092]UOY05589.1 TonB-dependent receptor [Muricauda sp. SCSIO 64092]